MRRGQAILETVLAVFFVTLLFMGLFELALKLNKRIVLDYAAQRVARAKTVGLNDYMCRKTARVATISIAGERLWPEKTSTYVFDTAVDLGRIPIYLESDHESRARAILDYEFWHKMKLSMSRGGGISGDVTASISSEEDNIVGEANIEAHYPYYLDSLK